MKISTIIHPIAILVWLLIPLMFIGPYEEISIQRYLFNSCMPFIMLLIFYLNYLWILPRHIERWKNMKMENWKKNIHATKYYARVRPKKIPEMLKKAMKLTNAEVEEYFGETLKLLEETNKRPED